MKKHIHILIISALVLITALSSLAQTQQLTLEAIWGRMQYMPRGIQAMTPMNDDRSFCMLDNDSIKVFEYETGKMTRIMFSLAMMPEVVTEGFTIEDFALSPDETRILLTTGSEQIYRHSFRSEFYVFDLKANRATRLSAKGKQQLATFSPDGQQVAFVRDNNIFITDLRTGTERAVTTDGERNRIINGATDWVYEEEFSFPQAFYWSPDSRSIAYYRFDESGVKEFFFPKYGALYPEEVRYKYPKAGEANSVVSIHVFHLESGKTVTMDTGGETDIYIPRVQWSSLPGQLAIQRLNRLQNHLEILLADASAGTSQVIYEERNKYYIDITDDLTFLGDQKHFLISSEKSGYNHFYLVDFSTGQERALTSGTWDVAELLGVDEKNGLVYYLSTETSPLDRMLYSIDLKGRKRTLISNRQGTHAVEFSAGYSYYVNTWSDANTPTVVTMNDRRGKELRVLRTNARLEKAAQDMGWTPIEFFSFGSPEITLPDGKPVELNGFLVKPWNFDPAKKYPVVMLVYGGPGSQMVRNAYSYRNAWQQYLASKGYVVACVDNRGTGARGEEFKKMTYLQLGKYETIDQIEAAKYLAGLPWVDGSRIGIWGWSYGGFMSTLAITKGADHFKAAIAVAPVSNWRYYDNIYTERFMRTPQENPEGYDSNSPIFHVDKLKGNYLLIHGTADDNVHYQNSIDLVSALVAANRPFDLMFYPNSNHGIYTGKNTTLHLYEKMTTFILEKL
ncbi:MAG TPA: S9 family peptidase [Bacteroidales bacterium]|nr:S9 family peptidase [Bacteroidales bacterium]